MKRAIVAPVVVVVVAAIGGLLFVKFAAGGFSTISEPTGIEKG